MDDRRILAWAGLGKPVLLTEEQKKSITTTYELPLGRNEKLYEFFQGTILPSAVKHGYDPSRHFREILSSNMIKNSAENVL